MADEIPAKSVEEALRKIDEATDRLTEVSRRLEANVNGPDEAQSILGAIAVLQETVSGLVGAGPSGEEITRSRDILMSQLIKNSDALRDARTSVATVDERVKNIISLIQELAGGMSKNAASGGENKWGRATEGDDTRDSRNIRIKYRPKDSV
jgi:hypothetical protein